MVGGILIGLVSDRTGRPFAVLAGAYLLGALAILASYLLFGASWVLLCAVLLVGTGVAGANAAISALAGSLYPTVARATGVGWAYGVGRIGAITGPIVGSYFLAIGFDEVGLFGLTAVPAVAAALGVIALASLAAAARRRGDTRLQNIADDQGLEVTS